ncbi:MAG: hypothetical protein Q7S27_06495 [Nanoarchaeota archaeon]|nr:hypothetical protein [Nanoarchaeota archaeon]
MNETKSLSGEIVEVGNLASEQIEDMYHLMSSYYEKVDETNFRKDLSEKRDVILLRDSVQGQIKGFSTLMLLEQTVDDVPITALFSGDTIIDKEYWGENELPKWWGRYSFSLIDEMPDKEIYWFLMSKGYKTYRFLPVFFNEFYPRRDVEFPTREKKILDAFAYSKFPNHYNPISGIISFNGEKDCLKKGVADIDESRMKNPDIRYFVERNPHWQEGDELACLVRLTKDNFNRMGHRAIGNYQRTDK